MTAELSPKTTEHLRNEEARKIAWCLQNPNEFWLLADKITEHTFTMEPWNRIWKLLHKSYTRFSSFPSVQEAAHLIGTADNDILTCQILKDKAVSLYTMDVGSYTGSELSEWVANIELEHLAQAILNPDRKHDFVSRVAYLEERLEKVKLLAGGSANTMIGERFSITEGIRRWNEVVEEEYGAAPVTSGNHRLDLKLRDGGIRPILGLIVGPPGGFKTTQLLNAIFANLRLGNRCVAFFSEDSKGDILQRCWQHTYQREFSLEDAMEERRDRVADILEARLKSEYPGDFIPFVVDPGKYTPRDILRALECLKRQALVEDLKAREMGFEVADADLGRIHLIGFDVANHIRATLNHKDDYVTLEKKCDELSIIPKRIKAPLLLTIHAGQEAVGTDQVTSRNVAGAFGQVRPAKLVIAVAQTFEQSQQEMHIDPKAESTMANIQHLWAWNAQLDRNTKWQSYQLCVVKNTIASSKHGLARNVIIPCLADPGTCRVVPNFDLADDLMRAPRKTQIEGKIADGSIKPPASNGKAGPKG